VRHLRAADVLEPGVLMWHADCGAPDVADAGGSSQWAMEEIRRTFGGAYGPFLTQALFVAGEGSGPSGIVAAALTGLWLDGLLLAFVFAAPARVGRGMAQRLIDAVMRALTERGCGSVRLAVCEADERARRLYQAVGLSEV